MKLVVSGLHVASSKVAFSSSADWSALCYGWIAEFITCGNPPPWATMYVGLVKVSDSLEMY